jgi:Tol biopolymer transport system component
MRKIYAIIVCVLLIATVFGAASFAIAPKPDKPPGGGGKEKVPADPAIAYSSDSRGRSNNVLGVMNLDGSNKVSIYNANSPTYHKTWSGDGTQIAFRVKRIGSTTLDLWIVDVSVVDGVPQGSNARFLKEDGHHPSWSPVGDEIAAAEEGGKYLRIISSVDGTVLDTLYTPSGSNRVGSPEWSPDGSTIAFKEIVGSGHSIKLIDVNTKTVTTTQIQNWPGIGFIDWANEHDWLAFRGGPDLNSLGLYKYDFDTGEATLLLEDFTEFPTWSSDDSELIYVSGGYVRSLDMNTLTSSKVSKYVYAPDARPTDDPWS